MEKFVGRDREWRTLAGLLATALSGTGRLVLVTGVPGIGKSYLVERFAEQAAADGVPVASGRAVDDAGAPPLWPWQRAFQSLGARLDDVVGDRLDRQARIEDVDASRFGVRVAAVDAITAMAADAGLLVVLEDLQLADESSLRLLRYAAGELRGTRALIVATFRAGDPESWPCALTELAARSDVELLRLGPLSEADVAAYLSSDDRALIARTHERTGGIPLYLRLAGPDRSTQLGQLVLSMMRGIQRPDVIEAAAVAGVTIEPELLAGSGVWTTAEVLGCLDEAAAAGLVQRAADGWRFSHALVRDGVYDLLSPESRRRWHRVIAEAIAEASADASAEAVTPGQTASAGRAGEIAAHWQRAGDDAHALRQCARWARRAAKGASAALAFENAVSLLSMALAAGDDDPAVLVELATAEFRAGRLQDCLDHCLAAVDLAERVGRDDLVIAAALIPQGTGDSAQSALISRLCDRGLARIGALTDAEQARLRAQRACAQFDLGHEAIALAGSADALRLAESADDAGALFEAFRARTITLFAPRNVAQRLRIAERAASIAPALRQPLAPLWAQLWRVDAAYQLADIDAVDDGIALVGEFAAASGQPLARWHQLRLEASRALNNGDFAAARRASAAALDVGAQLQDPSALRLFHSCALRIAVVRGDPSELGPDFLATALPIRRPIVRATLARALHLLGQTEEAASVYAELRSLVSEDHQDGRWYGAVHLLIDLMVAFGDTETAARAYPAIRGHVEGSAAFGIGTVAFLGSNARGLGRLAALLGRFDDAVAHLEKAIEVDLALGAAPFVALSRLELADALHERGHAEDRPRVVELARHAAAQARRLDMPGLLTNADMLLRRLAAHRVDNPLSTRELEVATLVARALSNREIAVELVVSERTVESHIRRILAKLDFRTRTEIATWSLRRELG